MEVQLYLGTNGGLEVPTHQERVDWLTVSGVDVHGVVADQTVTYEESEVTVNEQTIEEDEPRETVVGTSATLTAEFFVFDDELADVQVTNPDGTKGIERRRRKVINPKTDRPLTEQRTVPVIPLTSPSWGDTLERWVAADEKLEHISDYDRGWKDGYTAAQNLHTGVKSADEMIPTPSDEL